MMTIADSSYARDVALWVAGGDETAFTSALAAHELASWTRGHTCGIDESLATFDDQEYWIARRLALQGHNVIALPTRHLAGLRSPDAAVGGLLVEFKTYTGMNPRQLLCRVGRARQQSDRVVVGVEAQQWDSAMVRDVFRVAIDSARRRAMRALTFIGDDFQFEWGDWNGFYTSSTSTTHLSERPVERGVLHHAKRHLRPSDDVVPPVPQLAASGTRKGMIANMDLLRRNYDLVASVSTGGALLTVGVPWPLWAVYGVMVTFQVGNRVVRGWER
ncbi:hypothetical protein [[Mycobacterium] crassicus]|uniref:NERD domain-containing protein n=1 Tax=[Mycobacterium] crassicus TaxID=2872309 RepID=A0ABU5XM75_9MYCO|nr:hypothetical protein [Mycolicibacter sp. MYC098]MEB3023084.1 hypothetical protein [Mycolicibacter sp. MYC098]